MHDVPIKDEWDRRRSVTEDFPHVRSTPELGEDLREFYRECDHPRTVLGWHTTRSQTRQLRRQCVDCGELVGGALPGSQALRSTGRVDLAMRERCRDQRDARLRAIYEKHARLQRAELDARRQQHSEYLDSPEWRAKRRKVLERAGGLCEGCRVNRPTQVHHLTYKHWGDELLFELVALCDECHDRCHEDREP
jgi:hypothetical protein